MIDPALRIGTETRVEGLRALRGLLRGFMVSCQGGTYSYLAGLGRTRGIHTHHMLGHLAICRLHHGSRCGERQQRALQLAPAVRIPGSLFEHIYGYRQNSPILKYYGVCYSHRSYRQFQSELVARGAVSIVYLFDGLVLFKAESVAGEGAVVGLPRAIAAAGRALLWAMAQPELLIPTAYPGRCSSYDSRKCLDSPSNAGFRERLGEIVSSTKDQRISMQDTDDVRAGLHQLTDEYLLGNEKFAMNWPAWYAHAAELAGSIKTR